MYKQQDSLLLQKSIIWDCSTRYLLPVWCSNGGTPNISHKAPSHCTIHHFAILNSSLETVGLITFPVAVP